MNQQKTDKFDEESPTDANEVNQMQNYNEGFNFNYEC